jgi:hypothetical protein
VAVASGPLPVASFDETAGRAAYEAFTEAVKAWNPYPPDWRGQAEAVKQGWIAAAKAVRALL